ncbi:DUF222 domain-containing protein [Mycolicibacterium mengxianglii]|uniref:DUF222 domain-containing protein n=1 Tax=Mycolicibacterium mengxianglii TaxID=2736649 RepID=UPI0018D1E5B6|nr:DUF222 domain-containing protein [Mycolicibacterium mengxianglii]
MRSNDEILTALDAVEEGLRVIARRPLHQLRPADQRGILLRLEEVSRRLALVQHRALRTLVTGPPPVEFAGASWAEVLARRLRISVGEARRRIAEAERADPPATVA